MQLYKFGGGSLINSDAIKQLYNIVKNNIGNLIIVISAFGKTTNAFENILEKYYYKNNYSKYFNDLKEFHINIIKELFDKKDEIWGMLDKEFLNLENKLRKDVTEDYDFEYDQIVPFGEIFSTKIISKYLNNNGISNIWLDARKHLLTDNNYREAHINWEKSKTNFKEAINFDKSEVYITQGFIGGSTNNYSTTLGREGSDFSAAILANLMNAENVTIWKDVPGILSADPKLFEDADLIPEIDYREAIELTYYGAKVIHPKTIKPLMEKNIPLYVRSFDEPEKKGTVIKSFSKSISYHPSIIYKENQALCNIRFYNHLKAIEQQLYDIFHYFSEIKIKSNLVHISTAQITFCIDNQKERIKKLFSKLKGDYEIEIKENIDLITIRHYDNKTILKYINPEKIIISQIDEENAHYIIRN